MARPATLSRLLFITLFALLGRCGAQSVCNFGNLAVKNWCGYVNEPVVSLKTFAWTFGTGCTPSKNTGPCSDHTGDSKGAYIFTEASLKFNNMTARLASPLFSKKAADSGGCVQFYYHMYGVDIGTLNVYIYSVDAPTKQWSLSGEQGNAWLRADIDLDYPPGDKDLSFQVVFEGLIKYNSTGKSKFPEVLGDIALDDVLVLTSGKCGNSSETAPPTTPGTPTTPTVPSSSDNALSCDFEKDMCGFSDSLVDKGYWRRSSGRNFSPDSGSYAYFFISSTVKPGDSAILNSPQFTDGKCLTFSYVTRGDVGQLKVYADVDAIDYPIWTSSDNLAGTWKAVKVSLPDNTVAISFEAVRGATSADIAVDNVAISKTPCPGATQPAVTPPPTTVTTPAVTLPPAIFACNFDENNMCTFTSTGSFSWNRARQKTRQIATGPAFDHTKQDIRGYFLIADAGYKSNNSAATVTSAPIFPSVVGSACLKFYYHMYGEDMGALRARILSSNQAAPKEWSLSGNQGENWRLANVDFTLPPTSLSMTLEFTSTLQHNKPPLKAVLGNVAIDDILVIPGLCSSYPGDFTVDLSVLPSPQSSPAVNSPTTASQKPPTASPSTSKAPPATPQAVGSSTPTRASTRKVPIDKPATSSSLASSDSDDNDLDIGVVVAIVLASTLAVGGVVILLVLRHRQLGPFKNARPFTIRFKPSNAKVDRLAFSNDGFDGDVTIRPAA